jgi:hypothetical protein
MVALAMAVATAIAVTIYVTVADSVAVAVAVAHCLCHCRRPLPLRLPSTIPTAISVVSPSTIAVTIALAVGHCRLHHCWPLQLPSPLAITIAIAVGHFWELLPWRGKICIQTIEAKNAYLISFCLDSGRRTDQSRMTDLILSGDGQHQRWVASGKQWAANDGSGWQHGGSRGAAGWRRWLTMGGVVLLGCWGISSWQMAFVMMCWMWYKALLVRQWLNWCKKKKRLEKIWFRQENV